MIFVKDARIAIRTADQRGPKTRGKSLLFTMIPKLEKS